MIKKPLNIKRWILLGDIHFGVHANSHEWQEIIISYFKDFFIPWLRANVREGDVLGQLGDIVDSGEYMKTEINDGMMDIFEELASILPIVSYVGNHDIYLKYSNEINSVRHLKYIDNIAIYTKGEQLTDAFGHTYFVMPWNSTCEKEREEIEKDNSDYCFAHTFMYGFWYNGQYAPYHIPNTKAKANYIEDFKKYKKVISGHIHAPQEKDNVIFLGAICHFNNTDIGTNQRRFGVFDCETEEMEYVYNTISPEFKKITFNKFVNMTTEEANIFVKNNYINVLCPLDVYRRLRIDDINKHLVGYREIKYKSIKEERLMEINEDVHGKDLNKMEQIDVYSKIPAYIDQLDKPDSIKLRAKTYLMAKYKEVEEKTKLAEIELT